MRVVLIAADFESWSPQLKGLGRPYALRQGDMAVGDVPSFLTSSCQFWNLISFREVRGER